MTWKRSHRGLHCKCCRSLEGSVFGRYTCLTSGNGCCARLSSMEVNTLTIASVLRMLISQTVLIQYWRFIPAYNEKCGLSPSPWWAIQKGFSAVFSYIYFLSCLLRQTPACTGMPHLACVSFNVWKRWRSSQHLGYLPDRVTTSLSMCASLCSSETMTKWRAKRRTFWIRFTGVAGRSDNPSDT